MIWNKRGQEGMTLTTLLLIVLGVVVLAVIIIGATSGFDFVFGKFKLLPGQDLQALAATCNIAAKNDLKIDYCKQFKEVKLPSGQKSLVNCGYLKEQNLLDKDSATLDCVINEEALFCKSLKDKEGSKYDEKTNVNGKACDAWSS